MYRLSALSTQWLNPDSHAAKVRATRTHSKGIHRLAGERHLLKSFSLIWDLELNSIIESYVKKVIVSKADIRLINR